MKLLESKPLSFETQMKCGASLNRINEDLRYLRTAPTARLQSCAVDGAEFVFAQPLQLVLVEAGTGDEV
ncbi:hypothetical protein RBB80_09095 [Tunturiibacter gelidiferens]